MLRHQSRKSAWLSEAWVMIHGTSPALHVKKAVMRFVFIHHLQELEWPCRSPLAVQSVLPHHSRGICFWRCKSPTPREICGKSWHSRFARRHSSSIICCKTIWTKECARKILGIPPGLQGQEFFDAVADHAELLGETQWLLYLQESKRFTSVCYTT